MSALDEQIGGGHYKGKAIQPIEYIHANNLNFSEGSIVKYITRWREKGGIKDLEKIKHYVDLLIEMEAKYGTVVKGNRSDPEGDRAYPERLSELGPPNAAAFGGCLVQPAKLGGGSGGTAWGYGQGAQEGTNGFIGFGNERTR